MGSPVVMDANPSTFDLSSGLAAYQAAKKYKDEQVASQAAAQYKAQQDAIANKQTSDQQAEVVRYHASGHALWGFDDAVKTATYRRAMQRFVKEGMAPVEASAQAARETLNALIDYGDRSGLTEALFNVAPFATYRSKMPGAVLRATAKHPERVQAINRLSPSWAGGEQPSDVEDAKGNPQVVRTGNPLSDTLEGIDDPAGFARSTMSYPAQMLGSMLGAGSQKKGFLKDLTGNAGYDNYLTYGKKVGLNKESLKYILNQIPYTQDAMNALGLGLFPAKGLRGFVEGQTGVRLSRSKQKPGDASTAQTAVPTPNAAAAQSASDVPLIWK